MLRGPDWRVTQRYEGDASPTQSRLVHPLVRGMLSGFQLAFLSMVNFTPQVKEPVGDFCIIVHKGNYSVLSFRVVFLFGFGIRTMLDS